MNDTLPERLHTFVVSDIHLADAEQPDPRRPLWKRYKQPDLFIDDCFGRWVEYIQQLADGPIELILNGDIFDFDGVTCLPPKGWMPYGWLEMARGLDSAERKSAFKMGVILDDHPEWLAALRRLVLDGHSVVFVIGNHDMELHWPAVQHVLFDRLDVPEAMEDRVRVCEWFYISGGDTLIEHGNQYDSYCMCQDPLWPLIRFDEDDVRVRLPFGNYAARYLINGMGLFNPHAESTFIMSAWEYVVFFYKHVLRVQPLLLWDWFWGSAVCLFATVRDGLMPPMLDPTKLDERVDDVADRANASPRVVRGLRELSVHPAIYNPWKIARELWLDRVAVLALILLGVFQLFSVMQWFVYLSSWWFLLFLGLALPPFVFYARSIDSDVGNTDRAVRRRIGLASAIAGVQRVVLGHTHKEHHGSIGGVELLNTGTWSPAFEDPECTRPFGRKCYAWIRPGDGERVASLHEWADPAVRDIPRDPDLPAPALERVRATILRLTPWRSGRRGGRPGRFGRSLAGADLGDRV